MHNRLGAGERQTRMNGTVLVTGAGGFVGSAVVRLLVRSLSEARLQFPDGTPLEHVVAVLRPGGSRERLQELPPAGNWSIEYADLTNRAHLRDLFARVRPRAVLHLAVERGIYRELPEAERYRLNIAPLEMLFEGLSGVPGARLIHTSSAWVLQAGERLDEGARLELRMPYAENKAAAERLLPLFQAKTGVQWINLRLFNIFGRYEHETRLLPYLVSRLAQRKVAKLSSGEMVRDFSDVEEIARAYLLALQAGEDACGKVYHIGSGRGTSIREFAMTVAEVTGNAHLIRFGATATPDQHIACQVADPTRAQRVLQWVPAGDLEARIHKTVRWWLERRSTASAGDAAQDAQ